MEVPELILASRSVHRAALLTKLGVPFEVTAADIDETPYPREHPFTYTKRIAKAKALKIHEQNPHAVILAADTPVVVGRTILQTPQTAAEAAAQLRTQSGRKVFIPTAVVMVTPTGKVEQKFVRSWVKMKKLTSAEIEAYVVVTENWQGASGAMKIQEGQADRFLPVVYGSVSGIIGLPLYETATLLRKVGYPV